MPYIDKKSAIDALKAIRYGLWEIDIPSPTVPAYVEHHEQIKNMLEITDGWIKKLEEQPTADVVERKHGKWEKMWHSYFKQELPCCSVCGHFSAMRWKYCPNCGAKMDGKEETNDKD